MVYTVTLIPGDGIGPDVTAAARRFWKLPELNLIGKSLKPEPASWLPRVRPFPTP